MSLKLYDQEELDTFKAIARLEGKMEGFILGRDDAADASKLKALATAFVNVLEAVAGQLRSAPARVIAPKAAEGVRELLRWL